MENIKNISIKSYLASRGVTPKSERGGAGIYLSPLRTERNPSFKVDYNKNLWYDFGIGEGGSIIDLVMRMENCTLSQACRSLSGQDYSPTRWSPPPVQTRQAPPPPKTEITSISTIKNRHLIAYLERRAINLEIARKYCREVHYTQNGKQYFAIGFQSDGGGWELRNAYYKGSTSPKAPTTIDVNSSVCLLFEGFMDLLAYLTLEGSADPVCNVCVLNSVSNLGKATNFLRGHHNELHCYLDNDPAGEKALEQLGSLGTEAIDCSPLYNNFKDLNDYLMAQNP